MRRAWAVLALITIMAASGCGMTESATPLPEVVIITATPDVQATVDAEVAEAVQQTREAVAPAPTRMVMEPTNTPWPTFPPSPTFLPEPTPTPTPTPVIETIPQIGQDLPRITLGQGGNNEIPSHTLQKDGKYLITGCYTGEDIKGARGPNATVEIIFSSSRETNDVVISWNKVSEGGSPTQGCHEVVAQYTGKQEYCQEGYISGCSFGVGNIFDMHTFKMLEQVPISDEKQKDYESSPIPEPTEPPLTIPPTVQIVLPTATPEPTSTPTPTTEPTATPRPTPRPTPTTEEVVRRVSQSVVQVETREGTGSGFVINAQGDVITNAHVVGKGRSATVHLQDGRSLDGTVVGLDEYLDIAYIRLSGGRGNFRTAQLGNSDRTATGQEVMAIGHPLNAGPGDAPTVTRGIISAIRTDSTGAKWLQTDAPVNPGNSGGPLINRAGQVIGVVTSRIENLGGRDIQGVGFALSVNDLKGQLDELRGGKIELRPTPTPVYVRPTETPRPTPKPTKEIPSTGFWSTAKSYGSGDFQTAYINLDGIGPYEETYYYLNFRCSERELEFVVGAAWEDDEAYESPDDWFEIEYNTGSGWITDYWWFQTSRDREINTLSIFASEDAVEGIIRDQRNGAWELRVSVIYDEGREEYEFFTDGFNEAAKPIFSRCGR